MEDITGKEKQMAAKNWTKLFKDYKGQWVVLEDDEVTVVAHGKAAAKVLAEAAKNGYENPTLFKVPAKALLNIGCV